LNSDNRISFIEYLILHYKAMILEQFYVRVEQRPAFDISDGAIGM
jgi:hypothetical protein